MGSEMCIRDSPYKSIFQMKLDSIGMNADLSDPVKFHALSFSNNSGTLSNLADFIGSLETEMHHRSQQMR